MRDFIAIALIFVGVMWFFNSSSNAINTATMERVEKNYGKEIDRICAEQELPANYFKALVILECSGYKPAGSRFEQHVYDKLKAVKDGELKNYYKLTQKEIGHFSDETLKQLATSWGPLQLMGYNILQLGISIDDLKNEKGLEIAIKWCKKAYGDYLKRGEYTHSFHIHNTGRPHPILFAETHDPKYVGKGLAYIDAFMQKAQQAKLDSTLIEQSRHSEINR